MRGAALNIEHSNPKEHYDFWSGARYVAEELAWPLAILAGLLANAYGAKWWVAVPVGIAVFFLVARYYGRREEAAEDAYHRSARIGRYANLSSDAES